MRATVIQPPYPAEATPEAATDCVNWMRRQLTALPPGGTDLIVLPEYANAPGLADADSIRRFASGEGQRLVKETAGHAARLGALIAVGTVVRNEGGQPVNRAWLFGPDGRPVARYDKTHLTEVEHHAGLVAGAAPVVVEHGGLRFGFATCFDFYFPEYFEALAAQGVHLLLCPSYQRSESPERIRALCACRALDCGACLLRSSYAMGDPAAGGHSLIARSDGTLVAEAEDRPGVFTAQITPLRRFERPAAHGHPKQVHRAAVEENRRPGLYRPHVDRAQAIRKSPFPRLCAHRGVSQTCPENTLPAFGAALALGVHELELDLWLSRDGVPVVCHDDTVDRTTDGTGALCALRWADLRKLDAGAKCDPRWAGTRLPRFEEVLDMVEGRAGLNLHLKQPGLEGRLVKIVCDLLRDRGLPKIHYLAGDKAVLEAARGYAPEIPRACLEAQECPASQLDAAREYGCARVQFGRHVTEDDLRRAHDEGLLCNLFWSDEPEDAGRYVAKGIDVVLTNAPHVLLAGGFDGLRAGDGLPTAQPAPQSRR